ncbi:MAG: TetR/AcrR family transcriptional regulator [Desulfovibrio sp.]|nr:MAG: TetR/AcrR family transcriptional regulator [Desulfovibrio sp.]
MARRIIPITENTDTRQRLIEAVGHVLIEEGFPGLDPDTIAARAGVDRKILFRLFKGLKGLLAAYGCTPEFWPTVEELTGGDVESLKAMPPAEQIATFFKSYLMALRKRPATLEVLAWEAWETNELTRTLEYARERTALEFFELMQDDPPQEIDLTALIILLAGAVSFFAIRSRTRKVLGGIDLESEAGWQRIDATIDALVTRTLGNG